jgi:hypothetical protein
MTTTPQDTSRTAHLLALMKKGDDAFNARDFAAIEAAHHPDMTAHITVKFEGDQLIIISAFWDAALQARQLGLA